MEWIAISGSWRKTNNKLQNDVRKIIREIIFRGDGIVSGGALNVDFIAVDEALKLDPTAQRIKIFLPASLEIFAKHFYQRAKEGVITQQQTEELVNQLNKIRRLNPAALVENKDNKIVNKQIYYQRNSAVVKAADELIAFQVNKSAGVQDTIDKARQKGIPVKVFTYTIE